MDFSGIPWPAVTAAGGGWLLFGLAAWGIIRGFQTGRIVPRSAIDDVIHDRNEWRAESRIKDQQLAEKDQQLRHMAEVGELQKSMLGSLQQLARGGGDRS